MSKINPTLAIIAAGFLLAGPAFAQTSSQDVMKQCGEKWQAAKAANTAGDQTWPQFLSKCRADTAQKPAATPATASAPSAAQPVVVAQAATSKPAAPAAGAKPAAASAVFPAKINPKYAKEKPSKQRMQTCLDQYNENKAKNANGGLNWIQKGGGYYSECNKRLGGGKAA